MNIKEIYSYDNPSFSPLRNPARDVVKAYQDAARFFDTAQEYVYIEQGMQNLAKVIHENAHRFPKRFDAFIDMLHERHLMGEYPETPELDWKEELKSVDDVFSFLLRVLENIQNALEEFHRVTDTAPFRPMALKTEELMLENSENFIPYLEMWSRWDADGGSKTSFDSWCEKYLEK